VGLRSGEIGCCCLRGPLQTKFDREIEGAQ
jgi:hypothetical protein